MGLAVHCLVRVAILADHRQAGNRRRMTPQRIPDALDMEDPEREEGTSRRIAGHTRADPAHEP